MHGWLGIGVRSREIAHDIEHASLQSGGRMRKIFEVKIGAVVERNRDTFFRPHGVRLEQKLNKINQRNNAPSERREHHKVFAKRNVIVAEIVVAIDV